MPAKQVIHPEFGQYDRVLFGSNGFLIPRAFSIDEHSNFIKLDNTCIQIDNAAMRGTVPSTMIPLFQQWDGASVFGPYSIYVSDGYGDPEDNRDIQPSTFYMLMRNVDKKMEYLGGFSTLVVDKGTWKGISKATYDAFVYWCQETFIGKDPDAPIRTWLSSIEKNIEIKLGKLPEDQLTDALGAYQRATGTGKALAVMEQIKLPLSPPSPPPPPPVVLAPVVPPKPAMMPLSGSAGSMDVIPHGAYVELVE